ncbi:hypothetical protein LMG28614_03293 [Paraburkholderia ultramafica]|uniref:Uncharacterized protein n=1 Tax=Paraburkholderia ultramafica TaxID=1544867 RepID=A0A6S7B865_9BURK|nr:hypothetical protein LMG28614_03293 [Paraburkholderia ultramafica]
MATRGLVGCIPQTPLATSRKITTDLTESAWTSTLKTIRNEGWQDRLPPVLGANDIVSEID